MVINEEITNLTVREIMSSPIVFVSKDESILEAAKKMFENNISHLVLIDGKEVLGVITKDIIIYEVLAQERDPKNTLVSDLSREPLMTVKADTTVTEVTKLFSRKDISLIGVTYKGKLVGVITASDIIRVFPDIIEAYMQRESFEREPLIKANASVLGYCDRCGVWSDRLVFVDGKYYCPDCIADLFGEEIATEEE